LNGQTERMAALFSIARSKSKIEARWARALKFAMVELQNDDPSNVVDLSASWRAPMKEIIKSAIVIHPAFGCEMTFVTDKKGWVLIVSLKFHQREMISPHQCLKLHVIIFASRPRDARVVVKISAYGHAKN
jgi:hypothetical protein